jgi:hypothetical protein
MHQMQAIVEADCLRTCFNIEEQSEIRSRNACLSAGGRPIPPLKFLATGLVGGPAIPPTGDESILHLLQ